MRLYVLALLLLLAIGNAQAEGRRQRAASCRAMCRQQIQECISMSALSARRCQRRVLRRCRATGLSTCLPPTTTTLATATTMRGADTTTTTSASTTTLADTTTTTLAGPFPAPDVRGSWRGDFYPDYYYSDNLSELDTCGYLEDSAAPVEGSLVIVGDAYDPYAETLDVSGTLGPLTNFNAPVTSFPIVVGKVVGAGNWEIFGGTARGVIALVGDSCDSDNRCCVRSDVEIVYGGGPPWEPERDIRVGAAATLRIERRCLGLDGEPNTSVSCNTLLRGAVWQPEFVGE